VAAVEAPAAPVAAPATQTSKIDTREFSEQTLFDTDSAQLNSSGLSVMSGLFSALSEYKGITGLAVAGHTDSRGSEAYNVALSEQRAQTVAAQISAVYPDARIDVAGMGESSPIASNDTAEGRQLNRRVDIEVTATRMVFN
jgi:OOP family OmpA-OmpF porin